MTFKDYALSNWAFDGMSAQTIYDFYQDYNRLGCNYPLDPDDLCRCIQVLRLIFRDNEEAKTRLLAKIGREKDSKEYKALSDNWIELMNIFKEEWETYSAPKTYDFMKKIYSEEFREAKK